MDSDAAWEGESDDEDWLRAVHSLPPRPRSPRGLVPLAPGSPSQTRPSQECPKSKDVYSKRLLRSCRCKRKCHLWCQSNFQWCWDHRQAWAAKTKADQYRELFNRCVRLNESAKVKRTAAHTKYHMFGRSFCKQKFADI